jgi:hypothetical protein
MTALAQGCAGLALVMSFALLVTRQVSAASVLLFVQSGAVAIAAVVMHRPVMAAPSLLLGAGAWFARDHVITVNQPANPAGGTKPGIAAGAALAILCQSQGGLALPLAIVLLSVLLAATRPHPFVQVLALVGVQNGFLLAACLVIQPETLPPLLLPVACFLLPLPLAAGLLSPALTNWGGPARSWRPPWLGWIDLGLSVVVFATTLIVPLDPLASVFAPLLGLDGILRSRVRRERTVLSPARRGIALLNSVFLVLAVCTPNPIVAWLAVLAAMATALPPALTQRRDSAILAFLGAGVALFGLLLLATAPSVLAYFSLFAGFTAIAAVVPDLATVLAILILRLANRGPWPPAAETLGIGIALIALLACAMLLVRGREKPADKETTLPGDGVTASTGNRTALLQLSQASIAVLSICTGQADGRFAALVLLILLILTRAAARGVAVPVTALAIAGLGGVPPLGVFPGLVLVVLAMTSHDAWLLLPLGAAAIPILMASLPRGLPNFAIKGTIRSIGWLPLMLAAGVGYFASDGLVRWLHVLTAAHS